MTDSEKAEKEGLPSPLSSEGDGGSGSARDRRSINSYDDFPA